MIQEPPRLAGSVGLLCPWPCAKLAQATIAWDTVRLMRFVGQASPGFPKPAIGADRPFSL